MIVGRKTKKKVSLANESLRERFATFLRSKHRRVTQERFIVLDKVTFMKGAFSAEELHQRLSDENIPIAIATVYSTLELLVDADIVSIRYGRGACRYSLIANPGIFIECEKCGTVKPLNYKGLTDFLTENRIKGFSHGSIRLNITGVCNKCAKKERTSK